MTIAAANREDDRLLIRMAFDGLIPQVRLHNVNDGWQLLAKLSCEKDMPQLLLLDLNMPELTGIEIVRELRAKPVLSALPVIVLTTSDSLDDRRRCLAAGAMDFITKPTSYQWVKELAQQLSQQWLPNR